MSEVLKKGIVLNSCEMERGVDAGKPISEFCDKRISGEELDSRIEEIFSEESKKEAFGENYKAKNIIITKDSDGNDVERKMSTIVIGGMGTNVSSPNLNRGANKVGESAHLSSINIGEYYYNELHPELFNEDFTWKKELGPKVKSDFEELFEKELGLNKEFIEKHFFICDELCDDKNPNKISVMYNGQVGPQRIARMMDLIALYKNITKLKSERNNVGINCMLKTSSYIASLKISVLAGVDYITTAAGYPNTNPKEFLKGYLEDLKKEGKNYSLPAFGLLVSMNRTMDRELGYDYYIFEDGKYAGGHVLKRKKGKTPFDPFNELSDIKKKFVKAGKDIPPIYLAGKNATNKYVRECFDRGFDGVQFGTAAAVSEEACDGKGNGFKNNVIGGNHLGPDDQIDKDFYAGIDGLVKKFEQLTRVYKKLIIKKLSKENLIDNSTFDKIFAKINDSIGKDISLKYDEIINGLTDEEKLIYDKILDYIVSLCKKDEKIDENKIEELLRNYGNSQKFLQEFYQFLELGVGYPTHMVFDSTVGFQGRMKIIKSIFGMIAKKMKTLGCINCLTSCRYACRGNVNGESALSFCIKDRLNYLNEKYNMAFSGLSPCFYPEIRPIRDIYAAMMGTYVER